MSADTALEVGRLYQPIKQIADQFALAQQDTFIRLPGLRGYWPMSIVNITGAAVDHSGASADLSRTGAPTFGYDGNAFVQLGVGNDFLFNSTSVFNITGTEAWIASGIRGLTVGGWFKIDSTPGTNSGLISKDAAATQRGFLLYWTITDNPSFFISGDGSSGAGVDFTEVPLSTWHFIVGRFTPSTEAAIFVNGNKVTSTTSIPAAINVSTQNFEIGRYYNENSRIIEGKARDVFICAASLPDELIELIRKTSMP